MNASAFILTIFAAGTLLGLFDCGAAPRSSTPYEWIDRPWEIRYVLLVNDYQALTISRDLAKRANRTAAGRNSVYLDADELFEPVPLPPTGWPYQVGFIAVEFDRRGTAYLRRTGRAWTARRTTLERLVFENPHRGGKPYGFAYWSQGVPGDTEFSPAVCDIVDDGRYDDDWQNDSSSGAFGCREWTAQLYAAERPFIDVTSYGPHGPFIGEFIGWARFSDPHKPVIGLHQNTWLCIYDCPAGEKPGVIKDIKAWTTKHHYPMPERPPKQPLYPNSDYADSWND